MTLPDPAAVFTVGDLTHRIRDLLGGAFGDVWVQGEISQPRRPASGHVYLTLKDADAVLPCVIWRSTASRLAFQPEEGQAVLARGYVDVYLPHGRYQLVLRQLEPVGAGALQVAFEQMRTRLAAEGLFDPEHKQALPFFARRVALVTSKTGAAVRDMVTVIRRRSPNTTVLLVSVRVQGDGAAEEIADGIRRADAHAGADVIIVGRGGGSIEDLWAFNEEVVARAIFECDTPVVSAVGHETDTTIADLVADQRAATPSQAGELVVPDTAERIGRVDREGRRLADQLRRRIERAWQRVEALAERPVMRAAGAAISSRRQHLAHLARRLAASSPIAALWRRVERVATLGARLARGAATERRRRAQALDALDGRLRALSPEAVLARGYSLTLTARDGGTEIVVRSASDVAPGDTVRTRVANGGFTSTVESIDPDVGRTEGGSTEESA